jgi:hypothetical protein
VIETNAEELLPRQEQDMQYAKDALAAAQRASSEFKIKLKEAKGIVPQDVQEKAAL